MLGDTLNVLDVASLSDVGKKRQRNEDSCTVLVPDANARERSAGAVFLVADGMGGLGGGDTASQAGIDQFVRQFYAVTASQDMKARTETALEAANVFVREQAARVGLNRIGSTAAGVIVKGDGSALVFNVGDCRVYRLRNGHLERLSRDQSVMQRQIEAGVMTEEQAKSARNSMVTAFLGQPFPIVAEYFNERIEPGDTFLICSDGLWSLATDPELLKLVSGYRASESVKRLVKLALDRGGNDNITCIVARFGPPPVAGPKLGPAFLLSLVVLAVAAILFVAMGSTNAGSSTPTTQPPASETPTLETGTPGFTETAGPLIQVQATSTLESSPTPMPSSTATVTGTATASVTASATASFTPTASLTATPPPSSTASATASFTPSITLTPTASLTGTATFTLTPSITPTATPSRTPLPSLTPLPSSTLNDEASKILTPPTKTPTKSLTPTRTPTRTRTPTLTPSKTPTIDPNATKTFTPRPRPRASRTPTGIPPIGVTPPPTSSGGGGGNPQPTQVPPQPTQVPPEPTTPPEPTEPIIVPPDPPTQRAGG